MSSITLDLLDSALHSVAIENAGGDALLIDSSGHITANINGSVVVSASDLDIRDLTSVSDNVEIKTAAGVALAIDASGYLTVNQGTSPWVVSATDLDIRDLVYTQDSVTAHQGGSWSVSTSPGGFTSWKVSAATVTTTEGELVAAPLSSRDSILIQNQGSADIFLDSATGVSSADLKIPKGSSFEAKLGDSCDIFAITAAGSSSVVVAEFAA